MINQGTTSSELTWTEVDGYRQISKPLVHVADHNEVSKSERWALCEQLLQRLTSCLHCGGGVMTDAHSAIIPVAV